MSRFELQTWEWCYSSHNDKSHAWSSKWDQFLFKLTWCFRTLSILASKGFISPSPGSCFKVAVLSLYPTTRGTGWIMGWAWSEPCRRALRLARSCVGRTVPQPLATSQQAGEGSLAFSLSSRWTELPRWHYMYTPGPYISEPQIKGVFMFKILHCVEKDKPNTVEPPTTDKLKILILWGLGLELV